MFTGIVREIGSLKTRRRSGDSYQLEIRAEKVLGNSGRGDSIAVNGVCLTAVDITREGFAADVMPETLKKSNLGELKPGDPVNLEPALGVNDLLDGHLVSGHIDATGTLQEVTLKSRSWLVEVSYPPELDKYFISKGSVALNGISLTIVELSGNSLEVSLIPETWSATTFSDLKIGAKINIEVDMLGKYVVKTTENYLQGETGTPGGQSSGLTREALQDKGFI